jgi:hypothetical protein
MEIKHMPMREDETLRKELYGGHPPACTCVACTRRRISKMRRPLWKRIIGRIIPWI